MCLRVCVQVPVTFMRIGRLLKDCLERLIGQQGQAMPAVVLPPTPQRMSSGDAAINRSPPADSAGGANRRRSMSLVLCVRRQVCAGVVGWRCASTELLTHLVALPCVGSGFTSPGRESRRKRVARVLQRRPPPAQAATVGDGVELGAAINKPDAIRLAEEYTERTVGAVRLTDTSITMLKLSWSIARQGKGAAMHIESHLHEVCGPHVLPFRVGCVCVGVCVLVW